MGVSDWSEEGRLFCCVAKLSQWRLVDAKNLIKSKFIAMQHHERKYNTLKIRIIDILEWLSQAEWCHRCPNNALLQLLAFSRSRRTTSHTATVAVVIREV